MRAVGLHQHRQVICKVDVGEEQGPRSDSAEPQAIITCMMFTWLAMVQSMLLQKVARLLLDH